MCLLCDLSSIDRPVRILSSEMVAFIVVKKRVETTVVWQALYVRTHVHS